MASTELSSISFEMTVDSVIHTGRSLRCVVVSSVSLSPIVMSTRVSSTTNPLDRLNTLDLPQEIVQRLQLLVELGQ
uniref:Uncharacterized protein n=1 Tax=Anopheles epiroticus TaxID=199890 RepID=A0A182PQ95_9DIPT